MLHAKNENRVMLYIGSVINCRTLLIWDALEEGKSTLIFRKIKNLQTMTLSDSKDMSYRDSCFSKLLRIASISFCQSMLLYI